MKRIIILTSVILCLLFLSSCDLQEKVEALSENLKNQIIDVAGPFIEKDTGFDDSSNNEQSDTESVPPATDSDKPDNVLSNIPSDPVSDTVPDVPDVPDAPEIPQIPEYIALERVKYPLNKYSGIVITKSKRQMSPDEYNKKTLYGYGRFDTTLEDMVNFTPTSHPITYFKIQSIESVVALSFDLTKAKLEAAEGERSFKEIASDVCAVANAFCKSNNDFSNLRRLEIGSSPDTDISAKDYALLLNTIYDDNCKQNGENNGTTFINPEIRLVTGKMSTFNVSYIKDLMAEMEAGRNDEFSSIGGWSFSVDTEGKAPEAVFAQNEALKELLEYRNENYKDIEIYLNDFGWDTVNEESSRYVAPTSDYTSEELQAMYMLRAYLILNAMDVDKAAYSALNDTAENGEGVVKTDKTKKLACGIMEFFKTKMDGMYLDSIESFGENGIYNLKYSDNNGKTISAIWSFDQITSTDLFGNCTVSTYDKATGAYVSEELTVDASPATYQINQFVLFIESNEAN